ncbi:MAG TPA: formate dehydrogenase accessory sulfurtransferase FdhD [Candidatus Dormibacteraeota bacterium]|jgi:FdhD protein|nr:formate dehydrogenase accessory sulfurtransferase FdhD [Candidatus Dormibacteraeota bacterium]
MTARSVRRRLLRVADGSVQWRGDDVAAEEPLEIRIAGTSVAVTMRTPGNDFDLATGFLFAEGLVTAAEQVRSIQTCSWKETGEMNVLDVTLSADAPRFDPAAARNFYTTSSCGLCGKASIDAIRTRAQWEVREDPLRIDAHTLSTLPDRIRDAQRVFDRTGGLHAAGLFDATGELRCLREDVGRHNAVDKVIGWALTERLLPLTHHILMVSGRASFELTQKALVAGIPMLAAVSAPSSLAVELAEDAGMTLIGFLRGDTMNVYTGEQRVATPG